MRDARERPARALRGAAGLRDRRPCPGYRALSAPRRWRFSSSRVHNSIRRAQCVRANVARAGEIGRRRAARNLSSAAFRRNLILNPAKNGARFRAGILPRWAELAQTFETRSFETRGAPRSGVGHVGHGDSKFFRKLLVSDLFVAVEVVRFEQAKGSFPLTGHATIRANPRRPSEKTSHHSFRRTPRAIRAKNRSGIHHCRAEFFRAAKSSATCSTVPPRFCRRPALSSFITKLFTQRRRYVRSAFLRIGTRFRVRSHSDPELLADCPLIREKPAANVLASA